MSYACKVNQFVSNQQLTVHQLFTKKGTEGQTVRVETTSCPLELSAPNATKSATKFSKVIGWADGQKPTAPEGFVVTEYARDLINPRRAFVAPNGDVFVSESNTEKKGVKKTIASVSGQAKSQRFDESANRITLLRDTNGDGKPDQRSVFLTSLNQPFGMLVLGNRRCRQPHLACSRKIKSEARWRCSRAYVSQLVVI